jgi:excisionase family DNA binding protein
MKQYSMKVSEAGRILGTSPNHIVSLILDGTLPAIRLRRSFRIDPTDFQMFLERSQVVPRTESSVQPLDGQGSLPFQEEQQFFQESAESVCEQLGT